MESDTPNLEGLSRSLDDAANCLAAFVSCPRIGEMPPDSLVEAASETTQQMVEWRVSVKELLKQVNRQGPLH